MVCLHSSFTFWEILTPPTKKRGIRMRDPKRIPKTLKLIEKIWTKYPDLRLMQLVLNCVDEGATYYTEDKELAKILKETYEI